MTQLAEENLPRLKLLAKKRRLKTPTINLIVLRRRDATEVEKSRSQINIRDQAIVLLARLD
ncbi:hypothetical protein N9821_02080, partial [Akkermansiaceae bacterium]|nr:hypothetical protein [Akkermansiaceae bacterium]